MLNTYSKCYFNLPGFRGEGKEKHLFCSLLIVLTSYKAKVNFWNVTEVLFTVHVREELWDCFPIAKLCLAGWEHGAVWATQPQAAGHKGTSSFERYPRRPEGGKNSQVSTFPLGICEIKVLLGHLDQWRTRLFSTQLITVYTDNPVRRTKPACLAAVTA